MTDPEGNLTGLDVSPEAPWLGLRPFTEDVRRYFFGREAQLRDLFERITSRYLTILFGQSGLGKTSLLHAAVMPRLRETGFVPVSIRLDHVPGAPPLEQQVVAALLGALGRQGAPESIPLWLLLHDPIYGVCVPGAPHVILIFDQFEEIFTIGGKPARSRESRAFMESLADVIENRVPELLRERLSENEGLAERLDYSARILHVLLALRDDYLHQLERWRKALPSMMDNRMELRPLTGTEAFDATVLPGRIRCATRTDLPPIIDDDTGRAIVRFVAKAPSDAPLTDISAVPPLLSLLCAELNTARAPSLVIRPEQVHGRVEDILARFYDRCLVFGPVVLRHFIEDHLLSPEGFRQSANYDTLLHVLSDAGINQAKAERLVERLVNDRLVVTEERGGIRRIELTHDILSGIVRKKREEREVLAWKGAVRRRRARWWFLSLSGFSMALFFFAAALLYWALQEEKSARNWAVDLGGREHELEKKTEELQKKTDHFAQELPRMSHFDFLRAEENLEKGRLEDALAYLARSVASTPYWYAPLGTAFFLMNTTAVDLPSAELQTYPLGSLFRHDGRSGCAAVSNEGARVAIASGTDVRIRDGRTGDELGRLSGHTTTVRSCDFSSNGLHLVTASDDEVRIWRPDTGALIRTLRPPGKVLAVKFNSDGDTIVSVSSDGALRVWRADTGELVPESRSFSVKDYPHPDEHWVLCGSASVGTANATDTTSANLDDVFATVPYGWDWNRERNRAQPPQTYLVRGSTSGLEIWELADPTAKTIDSQSVTSAACHGDTGIATGHDDRSFRFWDWDADKDSGYRVVAEFYTHAGAIDAVAFSRDGRWLLTASADNSVRMWQVPEASEDSAEWLAPLLGLLSRRIFSEENAYELVDMGGVERKALEDEVRSKLRLNTSRNAMLARRYLGMDR